MNKWINGNGGKSPLGKNLEVKVRHCNAKKLKLKEKTVFGKFKDDGFYLSDGGELSYNWDIVQWRNAK